MITRPFFEWYDEEEPGTVIARHELRRLISRARTKKARILLITCVISSLFIYRSITKLPSYSSSVTFRVIEPKRTIDTGAQLSAQSAIIEYILDSILNHQAALALVKQHSIYKSEMKIDERMATRELVNDLAISVFQNFFLETGSQYARSVHVKILYAAKDPDTSFDVVQDVARLIREDTIRNRTIETEQARSLTDYALQKSNKSLNDIETQMAIVRTQQEEAHGAEAALLRFKMRNLRGAQIAIENQTELIGRDKAQNDLLSSMEKQKVGLTFYLVDYTRPKLYEKEEVIWKILTGIIIFLLILPFVGIWIAAFDTRVMDVDDIYRLGLDIVAHVPPFPGFEHGTLKERLKQEQNTLIA